MRNLRCGSHHFFSILFLSYMGMKQKHSVLTLTFTCFLSLLTLHCHRATATTTICTCPNALHIVYPAALLFTALLSLPHSLPPYICSKIFPVWINSIPNNLRWQSQHTTGIRVGTDVIRWCGGHRKFAISKVLPKVRKSNLAEDISSFIQFQCNKRATRSQQGSADQSPRIRREWTTEAIHGEARLEEASGSVASVAGQSFRSMSAPCPLVGQAKEPCLFISCRCFGSMLTE